MRDDPPIRRRPTPPPLPQLVAQFVIFPTADNKHSSKSSTTNTQSDPMEERPKRQSEKKRKHEGKKKTAKKDVAPQSDSGDDNDRQEKEEMPRAASPVMDGSSSSDDDGDDGSEKSATRPSKRHRLARDSTDSSSSPRGRGAARPSEWGGGDFRCFHGYPAARRTTFSKRHGRRCDYYACPLLFDRKREPERCALWTWAELLPEAAARGKPRDRSFY
mgnify:CR=1 FL=1